MNSQVSIPPRFSTPARAKHTLCCALRIEWWFCASFLLGAATPFTVPLVGKMPVCEFIVLGILFWLLLLTATTRRLPGRLFTLRLFWVFVITQLISFFGYVVADLYRESEIQDSLRGWARCFFLLADTIVMVYLISRSEKSLLFYLFGHALGQTAFAIFVGPLFGDYWKFGIGTPLTLIILMIAPCCGLLISVTTATAMAFVHYVMDFRSMAAVCVLVAVCLAVSTLPTRIRGLLLAGSAVAAVVSIGVLFLRSGEVSPRALRSNISREAMMRAAAEAFWKSPVIGQGSWFSRSDVMSNFEAIRWDLSRSFGGFGQFPRYQEKNVTIHSQILACLAEGGILGGVFFAVYIGSISWALLYASLAWHWNTSKPIVLLLLLGALSAAFFSPVLRQHPR